MSRPPARPPATQVGRAEGRDRRAACPDRPGVTCRRPSLGRRLRPSLAHQVVLARRVREQLHNAPPQLRGLGRWCCGPAARRPQPRHRRVPGPPQLRLHHEGTLAGDPRAAAQPATRHVATCHGVAAVPLPRGPVSRADRYAAPQVERVTGELQDCKPGSTVEPAVPLAVLSRYHRVQMRADLGHDLLGASGSRPPAAFAAGAASATPGWWRGPDGDLVPGDLLIDRNGHVAPRRSVEGARSVVFAWLGRCRRSSNHQTGTAVGVAESTGMGGRSPNPTFCLVRTAGPRAKAWLAVPRGVIRAGSDSR